MKSICEFCALRECCPILESLKRHIGEAAFEFPKGYNPRIHIEITSCDKFCPASSKVIGHHDELDKFLKLQFGIFLGMLIAMSSLPDEEVLKIKRFFEKIVKEAEKKSEEEHDE